MRGACGERRCQHGKENQGQGDTPPEWLEPVRPDDDQIAGNCETERGRGAGGVVGRWDCLSGRGSETGRRGVCDAVPRQGERESVHEQPDRARIVDPVTGRRVQGVPVRRGVAVQPVRVRGTNSRHGPEHVAAVPCRDV